jgi:hypothetical protein
MNGIDMSDKPSTMFIELDADAEFLQIGEAQIRIVRKRRRGTKKTRYEITAPRSVPVSRQAKAALEK